MKPLLVLGKVFLIGCLWSLFFIEGIRVILLINWHFDIFWTPHWAYLWNLWHSGWVIDQAKEWAFVLILLAAIPMWLTGWIFLSVINWKKLFDLVLLNPIRKLNSILYDINAPVRNDLALKKVVKKKSYKEIRPNMHGAITSEQFDSHPVAVALKIEDSESTSPKTSATEASNSLSKSSPKPFKSSAQTEEKKPFTHSVFDFDDDDDDFDLDFDYAVKSIKKSNEDVKSEPVNTEEYFNDYDDGSEENFDDDDDYRNKNRKSRNSKEKAPQKRAFDDFENDIRDEDFDEDSYDEANSRRSGKKDKNHSHHDDFDDDFDLDIDQPKKREDSRRNRTSRRDNDERDNHSSKRDSSRGERKQRDSDKKSEQNRRNDAGNPIVETLRQKGYEIITGVNIKNTYIDYVAVDANVIYLCLVDKEVGDWLADEERFNDEEPLWFSETNHRISPVRLVDIARNTLAKKLKSCKITFDLRAFVIIQNGNIINAEDMLEVWRGIDVDVTRINRGSPRELPLFSKSVEEVEQRIDSLRFESLKKLIRSIN